MANSKVGKKYCKGDFKLGTACGKCDKCKTQINNIEVEHEVIYPNQKEIDAANEWLKHKEEYLLCLSERHPHYKSTSQEIETLKKRIITLKTQ